MPRDDRLRGVGFLDEPGHLVRIATVDEDGMPRVVPIWFIHRDGEILFTPRGPSVFLANLRRDPARRVVDRRGAAAVPQGDGAGQRPRSSTTSVRTTRGATSTARSPTGTSRRSAADAYVDDTIDQPRALLAVPLERLAP